MKVSLNEVMNTEIDESQMEKSFEVWIRRMEDASELSNKVNLLFDCGANDMRFDLVKAKLEELKSLLNKI